MNYDYMDLDTLYVIYNICNCKLTHIYCRRRSYIHIQYSLIFSNKNKIHFNIVLMIFCYLYMHVFSFSK